MYDFKIFSQIEPHNNFAKAQEDGWEIAGDIKIGWTSAGKHTQIMWLPMKRRIK